jgi:hypothetical protein
VGRRTEPTGCFSVAKQILVSGQGVREGIALELLKIVIGTPDIVREASLSSLVSRFDGWKPDAASRVGLSFEYVKSEASPDTGIPFVGDELAPVPRTQSYQSSLDQSGQDIYRVRLDAEHRFGSGVTLRNKLYYTDLEWDSDGTLVLGAFPTPVGSIVPRILAILDDRQKIFGDQLEASVTFKTGGVSRVPRRRRSLPLDRRLPAGRAFLQPVDLLNRDGRRRRWPPTPRSSRRATREASSSRPTSSTA